MTDDKNKIVSILPEVKKQIPDYYINNVTMLTALYEFMMTFGIMSGPDIKPEPLLIIRMSPQHAKVFSKLLAKNVEEYETRIGEIKLPEDLIKQLGIK